MSADTELGYVYLPVGTATNDFYGGHRLGDNLFANSLVALDAVTGARVWHFQFVHHDLWDSDPPAAPNLVDLTIDGRRVKAVAQVTKQAFTYVFDRETGDPIWPIEERAVPASDVPGERAAPTQPLPTKPPAFDRQGLSADDLIDFTPELRREAVEILQRHRHGPIFTPPSLPGEGPDATLGTINLPGYIGGANWTGAAIDPETGIMYVPSATIPSLSGLATPEASDATLRYVRAVTTRVGPQGLPLTKPPYGRITAIDLNEGEILWQAPNGLGAANIRRHPALEGVELPPLGGGRDQVLLTKTLLFSTQPTPNAAGDYLMVARDKRTGDVVAEVPLPARAIGPPITYLVDGIQGEFNWSSQHLDDEVLRCRNGNGDGQTGRVGLRCVRLVGRRQRGVRSSNGSGRRSRGGCRVRMPLCPVACRRPWVVVGSVRAVVCRRSAWRPDRLATCPWRSGKRSRSCERRAPGCVTLPVGSGEPRRLSRESYVATRRLGAAVWRIGRRLRSGTAPDVPSARR